MQDSDAPALHAMPDADLNDTALVSSHFTDFCAEADATQVMGRTHHEQTRTGGASQGWRQLPLEAFFVASATTVSELPVGTETTGEIMPIMPCAASSLFGEHFMEPAPVSEYGTPVPVVENIAPQSAYRFVPEDDTGLVTPQFSDSTVEALAPRIIGSLPLVPESAVS